MPLCAFHPKVVPTGKKRLSVEDTPVHVCKDPATFVTDQTHLRNENVIIIHKQKMGPGTDGTGESARSRRRHRPIHIGHGWNEIISLSRANQCNMLVSPLTPSSHYWTWGPAERPDIFRTANKAKASSLAFIDYLLLRELCVRPFRPGKRHIIECLIM